MSHGFRLYVESGTPDSFVKKTFDRVSPVYYNISVRLGRIPRLISPGLQILSGFGHFRDTFPSPHTERYAVLPRDDSSPSVFRVLSKHGMLFRALDICRR